MKLLEMGLGFEVPLLYNKQERNFNPKEGDMMEKKEDKKDENEKI